MKNSKIVDFNQSLFNAALSQKSDACILKRRNFVHAIKTGFFGNFLENWK